MNSKNLHKHAVPVVIVAAGLFIGAGVAGLTSAHSLHNLGLSLLSPVVSVSPKANGTAEIKLSDRHPDGAVQAVKAMEISAPLSVGLSAAAQQ